MGVGSSFIVLDSKESHDGCTSRVGVFCFGEFGEFGVYGEEGFVEEVGDGEGGAGEVLEGLEEVLHEVKNEGARKRGKEGWDEAGQL